MQSVDLSQLKELDKVLDGLLEEMPQARRELNEKLGRLAKQEVDNAIDARLNDGSEKIKIWQELHIGSKGGYAAIRPKRAVSGNNSPGAITRYLEEGHRIRPPSGRNKFYRARIRHAYINGRHFYQSASGTVEAKAIQAIQKFADELADKLGGG